MFCLLCWCHFSKEMSKLNLNGVKLNGYVDVWISGRTFLPIGSIIEGANLANDQPQGGECTLHYMGVGRHMEAVLLFWRWGWRWCGGESINTYRCISQWYCNIEFALYIWVILTSCGTISQNVRKFRKACTAKGVIFSWRYYHILFRQKKSNCYFNYLKSYESF